MSDHSATPRPARAVRSRGIERREALIAAATAHVMEHGVSSLSHRAVAASAGVPLGSTTYYFASIDELRAEALSRLILGDAERRQRVLGEPLGSDAASPELAARLLDLVFGERITIGADRLALYYERIAEAARAPQLAEVLRDGAGHLEADIAVLTAGTRWEAADPAGLLAVVDGRAIAWVVYRDRPQQALFDAVAADLEVHAR